MAKHGHGETLYNAAHIQTRNSIERLFGVLKRRFPVLAYGIRLNCQTTLTVIVAAAVLHNIACEMNEEETPNDINVDEVNYLIEMANIIDQPIQPNHNVRDYRNEIINYFENLP